MMGDKNVDVKENLTANSDDDELAGLPISKRPRITPRNSILVQEPKPTPHANLRALAGLIRKPSSPARRRASSAGTAFSASRIASTTPLLQPQTTPRSRRPLQPIAFSTSNPTTPHTIRALRHRRATPGQDRRKSGRTKRETPRDALRNLSKILATNTQALRPSPLSAQPTSSLIRLREQDEFEDELSPEQPKFTIPIDNDEDNDSSLMDRPRLSMPLEEVEDTAKSLEVPRTAPVGEEQGRQSRESFGSLRFSDKFNAPEDSSIDDFHGDGIVDGQQWQEVEDGIGNLTKARDSGGDLQRLIHENSDQDDELSSGQLEPSPHAAGYSPFILKIPDVEPKQQLLNSPAYENLPEDDIAQFGTPLPQSDMAASRFLQPVIAQRPAAKPISTSTGRRRTRKALKMSRHGISYSSFPVGITKSIATAFARSTGKKKARLNKETMNAILEASDKFFEQLGGDLGVIAGHARRKTIDGSDVIAIMQRQRQVSLRATAFSLASRYLPGESLREMRMTIPKPVRQRKTTVLEDIPEDIGEEDV